ncbi:MAG: signal recognition particle protein [Myxococcota bacterium]|nr:signal recognition particle protein [Myxococcota bacterium]
MLETLTRGFRDARLKLQGKARLDEENIHEALRDVRDSLLEGDVELGVARTFVDRVRERALGEVVTLKAGTKKDGTRVSPGDHFVKICHDELAALMGGESVNLDLDGDPAVIMMVGLQGSGKTTTSGKLAQRLIKDGHKPMLVAADIYRPAAIEQLTTLGARLEVPVFSIKGMAPVELCAMAVAQARSVGRDVVIIDTAGRLAIDNPLMDELVAIRERTRPRNILFVCDAMIGQDAVRTAAEFDRRLDFSGFVLTKMDGDARGGAALSIREVTGKPVLFQGMGEGLDKLEVFRPEGLASRILGMGDVVGLVQDLQEHVDEEKAEQDAKKMLQGDFTFEDFLSQMEMIQKMGSLVDLMDKLPGFSDIKNQIPPEALDERELGRVKAIIYSMTPQERRNPDLLNESRMRRIATGCGRTVEDVREMHKRFHGARKMMGQMGAMSGLMGSAKKMRKMQKRMKAAGMGDMDLFGGMQGAMPGGMAQEKEQLSAEERIEKRKRAQEKRRARKRRR